METEDTRTMCGSDGDERDTQKDSSMEREKRSRETEKHIDIKETQVRGETDRRTQVGFVADYRETQRKTEKHVAIESVKMFTV